MPGFFPVSSPALCPAGTGRPSCPDLLPVPDCRAPASRPVILLRGRRHDMPLRPAHRRIRHARARTCASLVHQQRRGRSTAFRRGLSPSPRADGRRQPPGLPRRAVPGRRAAGYAQSPPQRVAFLPEPISLQEFILHFRRAAWQSRQEARRPPFHGAAAVLCSPQIPATGFACPAAGAAGRDGVARVRVNFHNKKFSALFVC